MDCGHLESGLVKRPRELRLGDNTVAVEIARAEEAGHLHLWEGGMGGGMINAWGRRLSRKGISRGRPLGRMKPSHASVE